ncbi:MAG: Uncharacterized protein AUREO_060610 [Aureobasidium pullulans]|nr:MAG: Uncharacterized protein AUREO_060610 [Aureobasidium pullulans]THY37474.1 hypothetical protein D6C99_09653 [Aureobasidium pullulans]
MALKQKATQMKETELLFCQHILREFIRPKHKRYVYLFEEPVDAARVPSYHTIIKKPIDLATITTKLENQQYDSATTFKADFDLMFNNSDHFNAGSPPSRELQAGETFREAFDEEWMKQGPWLRKHHPSLVEDRVDDEEDPFAEPPAKRLRHSTGLFNKRSASNLSTPMSTMSKKSTTKIRGSKATPSKPESSERIIEAASFPRIALQPGTNLRATLQDTLRTMVVTEARAMLEDPIVRHPNEQNTLTNTMWQAMQNHLKSIEENGKASMEAWYDEAVKELAKLPFAEISDSIRAETKKALLVVMDRHYKYLSDRLAAQLAALKSRIKG